MREETVSVFEIICLLKNNWKKIIITMLLTTIASALYSFFIIVPKYSSSLKIFVGKDMIEKQEYSSQDIDLYQNLARTCSELIPTEDLVRKAVKSANIDVKPQEVIKGLTVVNGEDSQIITLKYESKERALTKKILDIVTKEFIKESKDIFPNGSIKVIETSKTPIYPVNFKSLRNIFLGLFIGFIISTIVLIISEYIKSMFNNEKYNKDTIIELYNSGKSYAEISSKFGISEITIRQLVNKINKKKDTNDDNLNDIEVILTRNAMLEQQNEILKKTLSIFCNNKID